MDKVRFPNIYILVNIHYYILPLTIIIVLAIKAVKAVAFLKARQILSNIFAMHYVTMQCIAMQCNNATMQCIM